jgi:hypothetical protein
MMSVNECVAIDYFIVTNTTVEKSQKPNPLVASAAARPVRQRRQESIDADPILAMRLMAEIEAGTGLKKAPAAPVKADAFMQSIQLQGEIKKAGGRGSLKNVDMPVENLAAVKAAFLSEKAASA